MISARPPGADDDGSRDGSDHDRLWAISFPIADRDHQRPSTHRLPCPRSLGKITNLQIRPIDRLFLDTTAGYLRYTELKSYVPGNPEFLDERAGSNGSSQDNLIVTPARDGFAYLDLRYLLPVGTGRDTIVNTFVVEDGLLKSGATGGWSWSPAKSGRSYFGLELFYRA